VTFVVQSQLTGVAADLPPPLGKTAVEPMPLRFERVIDPGPPERKRSRFRSVRRRGRDQAQAPRPGIRGGARCDQPQRAAVLPSAKDSP